MKQPRTLLVSTALALAAAGSILCGTVAARDVFAPQPPPPPFLRGVERVDLTDAQRQQIGAILDADREANDKLRDNAHEAREAFVSITPGASGYQSAAEKFADAEAKAVRARILGEAQVRTKVYAILTDAQRTELAALPKPPMDREPGMGHEHGHEHGPHGMGPDGPDHGPDHGPGRGQGGDLPPPAAGDLPPPPAAR